MCKPHWVQRFSAREACRTLIGLKVPNSWVIEVHFLSLYRSSKPWWRSPTISYPTPALGSRLSTCPGNKASRWEKSSGPMPVETSRVSWPLGPSPVWRSIAHIRLTDSSFLSNQLSSKSGPGWRQSPPYWMAFGYSYCPSATHCFRLLNPYLRIRLSAFNLNHFSLTGGGDSGFMNSRIDSYPTGTPSYYWLLFRKLRFKSTLFSLNLLHQAMP